MSTIRQKKQFGTLLALLRIAQKRASGRNFPHPAHKSFAPFFGGSNSCIPAAVKRLWQRASVLGGPQGPSPGRTQHPTPLPAPPSLLKAKAVPSLGTCLDPWCGSLPSTSPGAMQGRVLPFLPFWHKPAQDALMPPFSWGAPVTQGDALCGAALPSAPRAGSAPEGPMAGIATVRGQLGALGGGSHPPILDGALQSGEPSPLGGLPCLPLRPRDPPPCRPVKSPPS